MCVYVYACKVMDPSACQQYQSSNSQGITISGYVDSEVEIISLFCMNHHQYSVLNVPVSIDMFV